MNIADINTLTRFLCDANTTSYPASDLLITMNNAYEEVVGKILESDGSWQFDDTNFTTFPRGYKNLVAGQFDYSFDDDMLKIEEVHVLNSAGDYEKLRPIDPRDYQQPLEVEFETNAMPMYYDIDGSSVLIYPAPATGSVITNNGLRVFFRRTADIFTSGQVTTGTKEPGFASPWHHILAYKAAIPFCVKFRPKRVGYLTSESNRLMDELINHYTKRLDDERPRMTMTTPKYK